MRPARCVRRGAGCVCGSLPGNELPGWEACGQSSSGTNGSILVRTDRYHWLITIVWHDCGESMVRFGILCMILALVSQTPIRAEEKMVGMYIHQHWPYNHPYCARTWTVEDWRGYCG